jgi:hypothetical protein
MLLGELCRLKDPVWLPLVQGPRLLETQTTNSQLALVQLVPLQMR